MPEIKRFAKSVIRMYADDHRPPRFHVVGPDFAAVVQISSLEIISGEVRPRDVAEALAWAGRNKKKLKKLRANLNEREQP